MSVSIQEQVYLMEIIADRIDRHWKSVAEHCLTMDQAQEHRKFIYSEEVFGKLSFKRREAIRFYEERVRNKTLRENEKWGWWYLGNFTDDWGDLPREIRYKEEELSKIPKGHFWVKDGKVTTKRFFVHPDYLKTQDTKTHFPQEA